MSPDTADAYLADGLTDELIARLGQIERLAVKSRTAVRHYRKLTHDVATLGRILGVAHIVNGTVRRSGARLRVTIELLRAPNGDRAWGNTYDRTDGDLLAIQEDVARAVASAIAGRLFPSEQAALAKRPARVPLAYEHFLRGNFHLARRTPRAVAQAIEEYKKAVDLDPALPQALARIGLAYELFLAWGWEYPGVGPESLLVRGLTAADRAIKVDSTLSDGWMALGTLLTRRNPRTWDGARAALERAIALDPQNAEAHYHFAAVSRALGDDTTALGAFHDALAIEPERAMALYGLGLSHTNARRYPEARRWFDSAVAVEPGFYEAYGRRAIVRFFLDDSAGARSDAETASRLGPTGWRLGQAVLALLDAAGGDTVSARARVAELQRRLPNRPSPMDGVNVALALGAIAEYDQAINVLEHVQPRGIQLWNQLRSPVLDPIRGDPRFQWLVEESRPR